MERDTFNFVYSNSSKNKKQCDRNEEKGHAKAYKSMGAHGHD